MWQIQMNRIFKSRFIFPIQMTRVFEMRFMVSNQTNRGFESLIRLRWLMRINVANRNSYFRLGWIMRWIVMYLNLIYTNRENKSNIQIAPNDSRIGTPLQCMHKFIIIWWIVITKIKCTNIHPTFIYYVTRIIPIVIVLQPASIELSSSSRTPYTRTHKRKCR